MRQLENDDANQNRLQIGFGPLTGQTLRASDSAAATHRDIVSLAVTAEECGFDSVWLSEHHFSPDGYLGGLWPVLGAIASRTERVVLGTRVALAPLYHPLRLAEDAAEVAAIAGGGSRLIVGLGVGYRAQEFDALGVRLAERVPRLLDAIEVCRKAWKGEPFSHAGPTITVHDITLRPTIDPEPQIWVGAQSAVAISRVPKVADGFVVALGDTASIRNVLGVLDAATEGPESLPVCTSTFVALTGLPSSDAAVAGIRYALDEYRLMTNSPLERGVVIGDAGQVIDGLRERARAVGLHRLHHLVVRLSFPGMTRTAVQDQIIAFSESVLPVLGAPSAA